MRGLYSAHSRLEPSLASSNATTFATDYVPYGTRYGATGTEVFSYTGKPYDGATGLYYFGARYYDPAAGRFVSEDAYAGSIGDPQSMNRYAYARENPMKMVDEDGHSYSSSLRYEVALLNRLDAKLSALESSKGSPRAVTLLQKQIAAVERNIDGLVRKLQSSTLVSLTLYGFVVWVPDLGASSTTELLALATIARFVPPAAIVLSLLIGAIDYYDYAHGNKQYYALDLAATAGLIAAGIGSFFVGAELYAITAIAVGVYVSDRILGNRAIVFESIEAIQPYLPQL